MTRFALLGAMPILLAGTGLTAQAFNIPTRDAEAPSGSAIVAAISGLPMREREERIAQEVLHGNVPSWNRTAVPITLRRRLGGSNMEVTFWAAPDYLAVGSDDDWFLAPLSPQVARRIGESVGATLPTPLMVDAIWKAATVKLGADSIPPGPAMITVPVFAEHNELVRLRRAMNPAPMGSLTAGHKKDVVLTSRLDTLPGRVAIYGWHRPDGTPIQPLNTSHTTEHVDYSHGIRLILNRVMIDGTEHELTNVLRDPLLSTLLNDEGPIETPR